jgi:hypothetical protein
MSHTINPNESRLQVTYWRPSDIVSERDLLMQIQTVLHNTKLSVSEYGSVIYVYRCVLLLAGAGCHGEERTPQSSDSDIHCILHLMKEAKKFIEKKSLWCRFDSKTATCIALPTFATCSLRELACPHSRAHGCSVGSPPHASPSRILPLHASHIRGARCVSSDASCGQSMCRRWSWPGEKGLWRRHTSSPLGLCGHVRVGVRSYGMLHLLNGRKIGRLPLGPTVYGLWHLGIGSETWHRLDRDEAWVKSTWEVHGTRTRETEGRERVDLQ